MLCLRVASLSGSQCSNWGSLASKLAVSKWHKFKRRLKVYCRCEVADEPVVVSKARPVKASNGVEDKTKPTINNMFDGVSLSQKLLLIATG
jgi:hypothetical protein